MICGFHFESQCEAAQSCSTAQYVSCSLHRCYSHPFSVYETPPHTQFAYLQIFTSSHVVLRIIDRVKSMHIQEEGSKLVIGPEPRVLTTYPWLVQDREFQLSFLFLFLFFHTFNMLVHHWNQQSSSSRQSQRTNVSFVEIILEVFQNLL